MGKIGKKINKFISVLLTSALILGNGTFVSFSRAASSRDISITVRILPDLENPETVTNLTANQGITDGSIGLAWTAPHEDGTVGGAVTFYTIRYATFSVNDLGGNTTVWWVHPNTLAALEGGSPKEPGESETLNLGGLTPGVTYYFAVKSRDESNNTSLIDTKASSGSQAGVPAAIILPAAITDLSAATSTNNGEIDLSWTAPGDDGWWGMAVKYTIKYATHNITALNYNSITTLKQKSVVVAGNTADSETITGLAGDTLYYFAIKTEDDVPAVSYISNIDSAQTKDSVSPAVPSGLAATGKDSAIDLQWIANTEPDLAGYNVYFSTYTLSYSTVPVNASLITDNSYEHPGLTNLVTYYFVITAVDSSNNESSISGEVYAVPYDSVKPRQPLGLVGAMISNNETIRISWGEVTQDTDGSSCTDLLKYNIYRAVSIDGVFVYRDSVNYGITRTWFEPENIKGKIYYYMVRAQDTSGNESENSMMIKSSLQMDIISFNEDDKSTYIEIPYSLNYIMLKENNDYDADLWIRVTETDENVEGAMKVYLFELISGANTLIQNFAFNQSTGAANLVLSYDVEGGFVKEMSVREDEASDNLAVFWFNGIEWIKIGGEVNEFNNTITVQSQRLGKYAIMVSLRAESFAIESIQPDKIFTPNGDGWNDFIEIQYTNPYNAHVEANIYNIKGVDVADMILNTNEESLRWNGNDRNDNPVPGGVYIYQIRVTGEENKILNGTVVVAR